MIFNVYEKRRDIKNILINLISEAKPDFVRDKKGLIVTLINELIYGGLLNDGNYFRLINLIY